MSRVKLPILNYHGLSSSSRPYPWLEEEKFYAVDRDVFSKHLDLLQSLGFSTLSCGLLENWFHAENGIPKPLMITFDDGHLSHYEEAAPLLKERKMNAVFFIPAGLVGQEGQMNWLQIRELQGAGFEIGSHGLMHLPLTDLPEPEVIKELAESKKRLEEKLGRPILSLSIPRGFYQPRLRRIAQAVGYRWVFTSDFDVNCRTQDPLALKRMAVLKNTGDEEFLRMIQGDLGMRRMLEKAKTTLRSVIPPVFYDRLAGAKRLVAGVRERRAAL